MMSDLPSSQRTQAGMAIVMALLVVALVAGIAASILADYGHAVSHLSGRHDHAQARLLARGAIDWARSILENDYRQDGANGTDNLREDWNIKIPPTPIEEGEISGELEELSGRFNINTLVSSGQSNPAQRAIFVRLLVVLGHSLNEAELLADTAIARITRTQHGAVPGNDQEFSMQMGPLLDIDELNAANGFTPLVVQQLKPFVVALPSDAKAVNVNTAPAEVLAAHIENLPLAKAQALVFERNRTFFTRVDNFTQRLPSDARYPSGVFTVKSTYFMATGRASWGASVTHLQVLLKRAQARPDILWKKFL